MIELILVLCFLNFMATVALGVWVVISHRKQTHTLELYSSHFLAKVGELEKNNNTLGKVMKIFEDETQILKRRNENMALKDRFQRTPR